MTRLELVTLSGTYAVCRLPEWTPIPGWAMLGDFFSITRTDEELSIVCAQGAVPESTQAERGWICLKVLGPLDFALTGILANLASVLAKAGISIFTISTYDTDYLLLKQADADAAIAALIAAGHRVVDRT